MMSSGIAGFVLSLLLCVYFIPSVHSNSCGCVREYSCTGCAPCEEFKPFCPLSETGRKDFIPSNLGNCDSWSLGYDITVTNKVTGTVNVTLWLPQNFREKGRYEVILLIRSTPNGEERSSSIAQNHSTKYFKVARSNLTCNAAVSFEFAFLYDGIYELQISQKSRSASVSSVCKSQPFPIKSLYHKKLLNNLTPTTFHRYIPQRQELIFNANFGYFSTGLSPYATVVVLKSKVDMSLSDCSGSGNDVAKYILNESETEKMCCQYTNNYTELSNCPCKWLNSKEMLECSFQNVLNGDYCFVFEFWDPRCKPWTLWTKDSVFCRWSHNASVYGNQTIDVYSLQSRPSSNSTIILTLIIILVLLLSFALIIYIYKPKCISKLRCGLNNYAANNMMSRSTESSNVSWLIKDYYEKINFPDVLLLYPRDSDEFMAVMEEFRKFLKSNHCKVHDPWDDDIYSNVVESHELWSLSYITNDNVKIIIVLSECSKKFETALLKNYLLQYREPETLDTIFIQSLSAIHQYFSNKFNSYQRIFVIQLDDDSPAMNFEFITPATVYTIPQSTKFLVQDLLSGNSDLPNPRVTKLKEATTRYKNFRKSHPEYLRDILLPSESIGCQRSAKTLSI